MTMNLPPFLPLLLLLQLPILACSLNSDGFTLLALKSAVSSDPTLTLAKWQESDPTPCSWPGISCISGRVVSISLPDSTLSGYIPSEIGFLRSLQHLSLRNNNFSKAIPLSLFTAVSLISLDLSQNALTGSLPPQIGNLRFLSHLDLSSNALNGSLPDDITRLHSLSGTLNLSYNCFSGGIPDSYGTLPVSVSLDLGHNNLSGKIPQVDSLMNQGPTAFAGNPNLCGFPLRTQCPEDEIPKSPELPMHPRPGLSVLPLPPAPPAVAARTVKGVWRGISVPILFVVLFVVGAVTLSAWLLRRKRRSCGEGKMEKGGRGGGDGNGFEEGQKGDFFVMDEEEDGLGLELEDLLRASAYVVGKSRSGIVYKVVLGRGISLAVRRLSEGIWRFREFEAEVEAIGKVRHPNVVRLRAYYYASDEKLLVSDFISNGGNLHAALHGGPLSSSLPLPLSWATRLKIAQGAARGLAHIHECSPRKYVHGNIKSSKILLDDDLQAYIADFGLCRLTSGAYKSSSSDSMLKKQTPTHSHSLVSGLGSTKTPTFPSAWYLAPEAQISGTKLTQKCDVYSFGIVLLEILTGLSPDAKVISSDDYGLEKLVRKAFREERPLSEIVDPALLHEVHAKKQVLGVFHVALGCTEEDPEMRPRMRSVSDSLDRIGCH